MNKLLTSGEFARICKTTKETLRHYNNIGLLTPARVRQNGYQMYSQTQVVDFMIISSLKDAGCSLDEIKDCICESASKNIRSLFAEKISLIEVTQANLQRKKLLLEDALNKMNQFTLTGELHANGHWCVTTCKTAHYIESELPIGTGDTASIIKAVAEHETYCKERGIGFGIEWSKTYRIWIDDDNLAHNGARVSICTKTQDNNIEGTVTRQQGEYLQKYEAIPMDSMLDINDFLGLMESLSGYAESLGRKVPNEFYLNEIPTEEGPASDYLLLGASIQLL